MMSNDDLSTIISRHLYFSSLCKNPKENENQEDNIASCFHVSKMDDHSSNKLEQNDVNFQHTGTLEPFVQFFDANEDHDVSEEIVHLINSKDTKYIKNNQPKHEFDMVNKRDCNHYKAESQNSYMQKKLRIKWSRELHDQFIGCVNRLGGSKKATPKAILKMMNCQGSTILHIKSHLQKYRGANTPQRPPQSMERIDPEMGLQIVEALRLQLDVQRSLYQQLESQKKLQLGIEEQAKQLKQMIASQFGANGIAEE